VLNLGVVLVFVVAPKVSEAVGLEVEVSATVDQSKDS
jgi:hypothetical protein